MHHKNDYFFLGISCLRTMTSLDILLELKFFVPIIELRIWLDYSKERVCAKREL